MTSYTALLHALAQTPELRTIRSTLDPSALLASAAAIQQIPAPTFAEDRRAAAIAGQFAALGAVEIQVDDRFNVLGRWPGQNPDRPALLVAAHTDTVFPTETDLRLIEADSRLYGPGIGDNSLGVAALLALLQTLQRHALHLPADIWLAANSREEGLGDLGGIRAVWQTLGHRLGAAIIVEGMALGRVYHAGIAVRRLRITCRAPGGHSWLHFGQPSAVHSLIALGARILALQPPAHPRTTYNIGQISGGHSVNSLATQAELYLDLRSEDPHTLADLEQAVRAETQALQQDPVQFTVEVVGDRPAGRIALDHPLVELASAALAVVGRTATYESGSTDANLLLAQGLPTVTVGITHGGQAHRLDEFIETAPVADGLWQFVLLVIAAAQTLHQWSAQALRAT